jgi:hypothetical protein
LPITACVIECYEIAYPQLDATKLLAPGVVVFGEA